MGHVKYLANDTAEARDCYERTISFVSDASEMHAIYLRLASIYLQEGRVSEGRSRVDDSVGKIINIMIWGRGADRIRA